MGNIIKTSIFDMFKIGPGPSSSHTIGPMLGGCSFRKKMEEMSKEELGVCDGIRVTLYGSLSSTGKGHGTDRSIIAGLMGNVPDTCDPVFLSNLLQHESDKYHVNLNYCSVPILPVVFGKLFHSFPYQNTMTIELLSKDKIVLKKEYYSIGGGFIICKGETPQEYPDPKYPYSNMAEFRKQLDDNNIDLNELMLQNEEAITGKTQKEIIKRLDYILKQMLDAVDRGLNTTGFLPGPIKLARKAKIISDRSLFLNHPPSRFLMLLNSYAFAASEENAAGNRVVTAPTSGASGVIPAIVYILKHHHHVRLPLLRSGLLAAAAVGFIIKNNASISGAEVGCQGEVGSASAMAAAFLAHVKAFSISRMENAAEIALEHHLGLTCDPIGGYVQIPCIERNAVGAVTAYNAFLIAAVSNPHNHKIKLDQTIEAMAETGEDMSIKYKETSKGGLAITC